MAYKNQEFNLQIQEHDERHATFSVEPLDRGYGVTLGNTLRRILLTAIPGAAIVSVKIDGVLHEFSTIPGVIEDLADIILNLKQVRFKLNELKPDPIHLTLKSKGPFLAKHIGKESRQISVLNPDLYLATLTGSDNVSMEIRIGRGKGYVASERNKQPDAPIGTISLDSLFSPVARVTYNVQPLPASKDEQEKLSIDVFTDGSISPKDAVNHAASMMRDLAGIFMFSDSEKIADVEDKIDDRDLYLRNLMKKSIDEMELSVRSYNCLQAAGINTIGELVTKEESEMLKFKNFGRKSLTELVEKLGEMGLHFGMKIERHLVAD